MDAFINRKDIKERTTQWFEDRQNYIDSQLKLKTGLEKESFEAWNKFGFVIIIAKKEFDENNPRIYPDSGDTIFMGSACGELAIVYFCQIFNQGGGSTDVIQNKKTQAAYSEVLINTFKAEDLEDFKNFVKNIKRIRDTRIAHLCAKSIEYEKREPSIVSYKIGQAWRDLDMDYFIRILEPFKKGIKDHISKLLSL